MEVTDSHAHVPAVGLRNDHCYLKGARMPFCLRGPYFLLALWEVTTILDSVSVIRVRACLQPPHTHGPLPQHSGVFSEHRGVYLTHYNDRTGAVMEERA